VLPRTFEVLYDLHFDFVFRCLRRFGIPAAHAEDACQEVFIVLHRRLGDLRPEASERAFLFGIAARIAADQRRRHVRRGTRSLLDEEPASPTGKDPFDAAAQAEAAHHLERFLAALDDDQRTVFMLVELEDFSVPEVGEALSVKLNTVYSRLRLARARFSRFVHEEGLSHGE
jgi:RNA polymerase sigma-70 factor (ECF subfamily)